MPMLTHPPASQTQEPAGVATLREELPAPRGEAARALARTFYEATLQTLSEIPLVPTAHRSKYDTLRRYIEQWLVASYSIHDMSFGKVRWEHLLGQSWRLFGHSCDFSETVLVDPGTSRPLPAAIEERLQHLAGLGAGWDGEGAVPPTPWALAVTRGELHRLASSTPWAVEDVFVVPAVDGGVRLEWVDDSGRELTAIVPPDMFGSVEFYRYSQRPPFEDHNLAADLLELPVLLDWMRGR